MQSPVHCMDTGQKPEVCQGIATLGKPLGPVAEISVGSKSSSDVCKRSNLEFMQ